MKENQANQTHLCPLCNESLAVTASNDQINIHLENCPALLRVINHFVKFVFGLFVYLNYSISVRRMI